MKIWHIGALVALSSICVWGADDAIVVASTDTLPGWLDPAGWGKSVGGMVQFAIGILAILSPLLRKAWRGKILHKIPWFARPFVKNYMLGWFFVAKQKFPYPPNATPGAELETNQLRRNWVVAKAKSGPWWIQLIVAGMDEQMVEDLWVSAFKFFKEMEQELK